MSRFLWLRRRWKWVSVGAIALILPAALLYGVNQRKAALLREIGDAGGDVDLMPIVPQASWPTFMKFGLNPAHWPPVFWRAEMLSISGDVTSREAVAAIVDPANRLGGIRRVHTMALLEPEALLALGRLDRLEHLTLLGCGLHDADMRHIARLHTLRELNLFANEIGPEGLWHLTALPSLERLNLTWTNCKGPEIVPILKAIPTLREIRLGGDMDPASASLQSAEVGESLPGVSVSVYHQGQPKPWEW